MVLLKTTKISYCLFALTLVSIISFSACNCDVKPDLVSELVAPTTDLIVGEPVDWDYVVTSVEEYSGDCKILKAAASIGRIVIDFFKNPEENNGEIIFEKEDEVGELMVGESERVSNTINGFEKEGIYLISTEADFYGDVCGRNEDNNLDNASAKSRSVSQSDFFGKESFMFRQKLEKAAAIVVVGQLTKGRNKINIYQGKPVYYVQ
ncbi:MAG: hypothetical protein AAGJ18_26245 [Bacteroidota bacterium]